MYLYIIDYNNTNDPDEHDEDSPTSPSSHPILAHRCQGTHSLGLIPDPPSSQTLPSTKILGRLGPKSPQKPPVRRRKVKPLATARPSRNLKQPQPCHGAPADWRAAQGVLPVRLRARIFLVWFGVAPASYRHFRCRGAPRREPSGELIAMTDGVVRLEEFVDFARVGREEEEVNCDSSCVHARLLMWYLVAFLFV